MAAWAPPADKRHGGMALAVAAALAHRARKRAHAVGRSVHASAAAQAAPRQSGACSPCLCRGASSCAKCCGCGALRAGHVPSAPAGSGARPHAECACMLATCMLRRRACFQWVVAGGSAECREQTGLTHHACCGCMSASRPDLVHACWMMSSTHKLRAPRAIPSRPIRAGPRSTALEHKAHQVCFRGPSCWYGSCREAWQRTGHDKHRPRATVSPYPPVGTWHDDEADTAQAALPLGPPGCSTAHQQKQFCARACYCSQEGGRRDALNGPLIYLFKQQSS